MPGARAAREREDTLSVHGNDLCPLRLSSWKCIFILRCPAARARGAPPRGRAALELGLAARRLAVRELVEQRQRMLACAKPVTPPLPRRYLPCDGCVCAVDCTPPGAPRVAGARGGARRNGAPRAVAGRGGARNLP